MHSRGTPFFLYFPLAILPSFASFDIQNENKETIYHQINRILPGVDNTSKYDRYCFQLCYYDPIEKLVDLDLQGKLFI